MGGCAQALDRTIRVRHVEAESTRLSKETGVLEATLKRHLSQEQAERSGNDSTAERSAVNRAESARLLHVQPGDEGLAETVKGPLDGS